MPEEASPLRETLTPEAVLLRLFRCMKDGEQDNFIKEALYVLGERCSFYPNFTHCRPESLKEEMEDDDLDSRLMSAWPGGWPGQEIVELDNVGDPGAWLAQALDRPTSEVIFGNGP